MESTYLPKSLSLLYIEDDEDDVYLFSDIIKELDIEVTMHHSNNGLEAIKYLNLLKPGKPRLIFTDLNMPIMSGWEFLKQIKTYENLRSIPIFVLSTANDLDTRIQALELGAAGYFTKPPTVEAMKKIIERVIEVLQEH